MVWYDFLKKDPGANFGIGNLSTTAKVLGGALGTYGIASALGKADSLNKFLGIGGDDTAPTGYQGGIPEYTANRSVLAPQVGAGGPSTADRRPGSGGRRYFTDMTYTPTGENLGGYKAPVASVGSYMPEDQIAALMEALSQSQAAGTTTTPTPTTPTPTTPTPTTPTPTTPTPTTPTPTTPTPTSPAGTVTTADIQNWFKNNPGATDAQIYTAMQQNKVTPQALQQAMGFNLAELQQRYAAQQAADRAWSQQNALSGALSPDLDSLGELKAFATRAMASSGGDGSDRAISSGEASQLLNAAIGLNQSPAQLAAMLGVSEAQVVNRIRTDYPHLGMNYLQKYGYAKGGLTSLVRSDNYASGGGVASRGYYLGGATDGMADRIPANIDGEQEAALSDGEFVVPADVVSHLGNGNSDAGAQVLYAMMDRVRKARTGTPQQGKRINPGKMLPK